MSENPSAFPMSADAQAAHPDFQGMSLRDWFAGQWLSGMLANGALFDGPEMIAEEAFAVADAMLLARKDAN